MTAHRDQPTTGPERGGAAVELTLVTPLLLTLLLLMVAAGRLTTAQAEVDAAARDAARSASLQRDPASAASAAHTSAQAALGDQRLTCQTLGVRADTSAFRAGGHVTVEVTCTARLSDLTLLRLPGAKTMHARFTHPIDLYRGVALGFTN
jgi:Flp pilus assembly protein TadG